jgi:STE24 endopeptidase
MLRKASLLLTVFLLLQALSATPWSSAQPSEQEPQATAETPSAGAAPGAGEETTAGDETTSPPELVQSALEGVPPDGPRMEAYSHGNYVLFFVGVLWSVGLLALIVMTGFGGWLQRLVERLTRRPNLKVALFAALYTLIVFIGSFPLSIYGGFMREKQFGFANQTFPQWMGDQGKALLVSIFLQVIFFTILYVAIRRLDRNWWVPGAVLSILFLILVVAIAPVFIAPLFNTFEPLEDAELRDDILAMARSQGIPAEEVYEADASRQSSHNNAYVTGLLGTQRIVLYDTILKNFSPREIKFVMGHEMGHYVLHHIWKTIGFLSVVIVVGFLLVDRLSRRIIARRPSYGIGSLAEPASLPLILLIFNLFVFVVSPAINSISRVHERQADEFGLEATGDAIAAASSFIKFGKQDLGEYHVHPAIEILLYSHPSLGSRISDAQKYAREHGAGPAEGL